MTEKTNQYPTSDENKNNVKHSLTINLKDVTNLKSLISKIPSKFGLTSRGLPLLELINNLGIDKLFAYFSEDEKTAFLLCKNSDVDGYKLKYKKITFEKLLEYDVNIIINTKIKDVGFKGNNVVISNQFKECRGELYLSFMNNSIFVIGGYINTHKLKQGEGRKTVIKPKKLVVKGVHLLRSLVGLETKGTNFKPNDGSVINFYNSCVENIIISNPEKIERIEIFNSFLNKVFLMGEMTAFKSENSSTSFSGIDCKTIYLKNIRKEKIGLSEPIDSWVNASLYFENDFVSTSTVNLFSPYKAFLAAAGNGVHIAIQERDRPLFVDKTLFVNFNLTEEEIKELLIEFHSEIAFPVVEMKNNFINALLCELNSMFLAHNFMAMNKVKY